MLSSMDSLKALEQSGAVSVCVGPLVCLCKQHVHSHIIASLRCCGKCVSTVFTHGADTEQYKSHLELCSCPPVESLLSALVWSPQTPEKNIWFFRCSNLFSSVQFQCFSLAYGEHWCTAFSAGLYQIKLFLQSSFYLGFRTKL